METIRLGRSDLQVSRICLGTMTFGEQNTEGQGHSQLDYAFSRGINFIDAAEMYPVKPRAETYGETERIVGKWLKRQPRDRVVLATKVAGPARMPWIRNGGDLTPDSIREAVEGSLARLQTDYIDLYQIHWPARNAPIFGQKRFDPTRERECASIQAQLEAMGELVRAGKIRYVGVSNETPWGVAEFVKQAEQHGLPRIATIQNPYNLLNRSFEDGLDEACFRTDVSLLVYSPLAFGQLTGKYLAGPPPRAAGLQRRRARAPDALPGRLEPALPAYRVAGGLGPLRGTGARRGNVGGQTGARVGLFALVRGEHDHRRHEHRAINGKHRRVGDPSSRRRHRGDRAHSLRNPQSRAIKCQQHSAREPSRSIECPTLP